jgi:hypothetical protein
MPPQQPIQTNMMPKKSKNPIVIGMLAVLIILAVYIAFFKKDSTDSAVIGDDSSMFPTGQTQTNQNPTGADYQPGTNTPPTNTQSNTQTPAENSPVSIASTVFGNWMTLQGGFSDYRIEKVTLIAQKATAQGASAEYFSSNDTNNAFIVSVDFSVKPNSGNTMWNAGNGHQQADGWVTNKSLFLTIDKNSSGYFVKSSGTGL